MEGGSIPNIPSDGIPVRGDSGYSRDDYYLRKNQESREYNLYLFLIFDLIISFAGTLSTKKLLHI
jgi:hypothetical protein